MSFWTKIRSQLVNLKVFRPYFPIGRTIKDVATLPFDQMRGGKSRPFPSIINFNITTRCNLKCEFCFNKDNDIALPSELSLDEIKGMVRAWAKYRPGIFLTGGEPFTRTDIFDIIEIIKGHSMPVGVVTNGVFLTEEKVDRLMRLKLDVAVISFHGTREAHDAVVGVKGSYDRAMNGLKLLAKKMKAPGPMINYVISENSVPYLRDFLDEVSTIPNIVVRLAHLNFLTPKEIEGQKRYWAKHFGDVPLDILSFSYDCDTSKFEEVHKTLSEPKYKDVFTKPILSKDEFYNWYSNHFNLGRKCVFVWRSTFINANGDVYPCQFLYIPMGNLRDTPMEQIWNNDLYQRFRIALNNGLMPGCSRCCKI